MRERIAWPLPVLLGGTATCLLEPLFDHLYGLWFPTVGQWTLFVAYGVHEPVWLPAAYLVVYRTSAGTSRPRSGWVLPREGRLF